MHREHAAAGRVVALASGSGSNVQALLDAQPPVPLVATVTDRPQARVRERMAAVGLPADVVAPADHPDRASWEDALTRAVAAHEPDVVVLAGFMRILSGAFVARWPVLNVHPSLLPAFPGAHAVADALAHGVRLSGATVHFAAEEVDAGPIVAQQAVPVTPEDTVEALHARIQAVEHALLPRVVRWQLAGRLRVVGRHVHVDPDPSDPDPSDPDPSDPHDERHPRSP